MLSADEGHAGGRMPRPSAPVTQIASGNLRPALTSFVGRERELAEVAALLERERLVALTGAGGSGKTRPAALRS